MPKRYTRIDINVCYTAGGSIGILKMRKQLKGKLLWKHLVNEHKVNLSEKSSRGYVWRNALESYLARIHFDLHKME